MSGRTKIEWCDTVWNPVTGCTKVSAGCKNCYAEGVAKRFWGDRKFGDVRYHAERLSDPLGWRKPRRVFVNSMSDLFHELVGFSHVAEIFGVMAACPQHTFIVLTKRPQRAIRFFSWLSRPTGLPHVEVRTCTLAAAKILREPFAKHCGPGARGEVPWPLPNVQIGVSVEDQDTANLRIPILLRIPVAKRIVSYEPALGPIDFTWIDYADPPGSMCVVGQPKPHMNCLLGYVDNGVTTKVDQVIIGGESGPNARPCNTRWVRSTIKQSADAGYVPCFVKQLGSLACDFSWYERVYGYPPSTPEQFRTCRHCFQSRKGQDMAEWPDDLRLREVLE